MRATTLVHQDLIASTGDTEPACELIRNGQIFFVSLHPSFLPLPPRGRNQAPPAVLLQCGFLLQDSCHYVRANGLHRLINHEAKR